MQMGTRVFKLGRPRAWALEGFPWVDELTHGGGAGARWSGGSGALSKRDGAGPSETTPIPPC